MTLDRQLQEDPVGQRNTRLVRLALGEQHLLLQLGHKRRQRPAGQRRTVAQHVEDGAAGVVDKPVGCGDALGLDQLHGAPTFWGNECLRAHGVDDRREIEGNDEHRAAHAKQPDQRTALVEGVAEIADREAGEPLLQRQVDGGRIGGMQSDEIAGHGLDGGRRRGEVMASQQPTTPSGDVEVLTFIAFPGHAGC